MYVARGFFFLDRGIGLAVVKQKNNERYIIMGQIQSSDMKKNTDMHTSIIPFSRPQDAADV